MTRHRANVALLTHPQTRIGRHVAESVLDAWLERIFRPSAREALG